MFQNEEPPRFLLAPSHPDPKFEVITEHDFQIMLHIRSTPYILIPDDPRFEAEPWPLHRILTSGLKSGAIFWKPGTNDILTKENDET